LTNPLNVTLIKPATLQSSILGNTLETDLTYDQYDNRGNPLQFTAKDGVVTSFLWGYNKQYPVAKVTGKTYNDAMSQSGIVSSVLDNPANEATLRQELDKLRTNAVAYATTYTHKSLIGITSETDIRGRTTYYEFDKLNRLNLVRDHDNNIVKKFCYNYAGQPDNCTAGCTNTTPDWQNTVTGIRCQQSGGGQNTGYQEQEQKDMNPCSGSYNQTQWTVVGYNATACPLPNDVIITSTNFTNQSGFIADYYNRTTGITYSFTIPLASGLQTLGTVPAGSYTLTISKPGNALSMVFGSGCNGMTMTGTSATFNKIFVLTTTCNSITLDWAGI
jgi:hypothetical protein